MGEKAKLALDTNIWISIIFDETLGKGFDRFIEDEKIQIFVSEKSFRKSQGF